MRPQTCGAQTILGGVGRHWDAKRFAGAPALAVVAAGATHERGAATCAVEAALRKGGQARFDHGWDVARSAAMHQSYLSADLWAFFRWWLC
jgi:hypothetical protein